MSISSLWRVWRVGGTFNYPIWLVVSIIPLTHVKNNQIGLRVGEKTETEPTCSVWFNSVF